MDKHFKVHVVTKTEMGPNMITWLSAHRDYSEELSIIDNPASYAPSTEEEAGERLEGMLLNKGHFGTLEHWQITFECVGFPHNVPMQARTHRVGVSFDVTSQRYTGKRVVKLVEFFETLSLGAQNFVYSGEDAGLEYKDKEMGLQFLDRLEEVFYARPVGTYTNRQGKNFTVSEYDRVCNLLDDFETAQNYVKYIRKGWAEEVARDRLAQSVRQSFFVTLNLRSLMHFLDMRSKADAQLEIQWLSDLLFEKFTEEAPIIADWYRRKRLHKNKLAP